MQILIVGSSRGKCLEKLTDRNTRVIYKAGGKISDLATIATEALDNRPADFVYFVAGLPDVSSKISKSFRLTSGKHKYQEFVFTEDPQHAEDRVTSIIREAESKIKENHSIPVFSTITPFHIGHWNHHRLQNHFTSHLLHYNNYQDQQDRLHTAINAININIRNINRDNLVITPKPSQFIAYQRHGHWRYRYGKLSDGTHTNIKIQKKWLQHYRETIQKNSNNLATRPIGTSPHEVVFEYDLDL